MTTEHETTFEKAFERLEHILEGLNKGQTTLEESLSLYEEADKLILSCNKKLADAEKKIEILTKNRAGELQLGADNKPQTQPM
ncbi:MAG: exodeoxyribonuclease VII small subunit [Verrucomicrobia bacterium]|nr:exodeoxyribonuclease VII small subunit [Verrucomicrobiota bacterium]MBS0637858.1 exodeoxyribonuclease VII small subunit [Verrucomicrobiota bacterium]